MIVDQNGRDHVGHPQTLTPCTRNAPCANEGSGRSLWPSRGRSDCPSLDKHQLARPALVEVHRRLLDDPPIGLPQPPFEHPPRHVAGARDESRRRPVLVVVDELARLGRGADETQVVRVPTVPEVFGARDTARAPTAS